MTLGTEEQNMAIRCPLSDTEGKLRRWDESVWQRDDEAGRPSTASCPGSIDGPMGSTQKGSTLLLWHQRLGQVLVRTGGRGRQNDGPVAVVLVLVSRHHGCSKSNQGFEIDRSNSGCPWVRWNDVKPRTLFGPRVQGSPRQHGWPNPDIMVKSICPLVYHDWENMLLNGPLLQPVGSSVP